MVHRINSVRFIQIENQIKKKIIKRDCLNSDLWYERKNFNKQRKRTKFTVK